MQELGDDHQRAAKQATAATATAAQPRIVGVIAPGRQGVQEEAEEVPHRPQDLPPRPRHVDRRALPVVRQEQAPRQQLPQRRQAHRFAPGQEAQRRRQQDGADGQKLQVVGPPHPQATHQGRRRRRRFVVVFGRHRRRCRYAAGLCCALEARAPEGAPLPPGQGRLGLLLVERRRRRCRMRHGQLGGTR